MIGLLITLLSQLSPYHGDLDRLKSPDWKDRVAAYKSLRSGGFQSYPTLQLGTQLDHAEASYRCNELLDILDYKLLRVMAWWTFAVGPNEQLAMWWSIDDREFILAEVADEHGFWGSSAWRWVQPPWSYGTKQAEINVLISAGHKKMKQLLEEKNAPKPNP